MRANLIIFIFAHQDDESGVFYEIERLAQAGEQVVVIYLTSGAFNGEISVKRNNESGKVLQKLGVALDNIHFLGSDHKIADGQLPENLKFAFKITKKLLDSLPTPAAMYLPAWEGGHQDHDAAHFIGIKLAEHYGVLEETFQFPLYTGRGMPSILYRVFSCDPANGKILRSKISCKQRLKYLAYPFYYRSQLKTFIGLWPFFLLHYIFCGTQLLQPVDLTRTAEKPYNGQLFYERRGFYNYDELSNNISIFNRADQ